VIAEALSGRRVAVTGATGFLGTALVERLLRAVPGCHVVVLVRPGTRTPAHERVRREILRNDAFARLREELGGAFDATIAERLTVVAGDVGVDGLALDEAGRDALAACDVVIHSAATVSFDSPLDAAVEVNLLGPTRVAAMLGASQHLIAVSTAYVAGGRRGPAPELPLSETPFSPELDWRAEVDAARRARADVDAASRDPQVLEKFLRQARDEIGAAGAPLLGTRAERLRQQWVDDRMVERGRARARGLGWPDAYAYTKALGERALFETRGELPVTIVRPSIIESSLAEPHPGWIRGFRMAEPVIISYGRGLLRDFPGLPEGIVDVVPVDLVVAGILAVAAAGPDASGTAVYQSVTGAQNPLRYRQLVDLVQEWFEQHPLYDADDQPIVVPEWSFPSRGKVVRQLQRTVKALKGAERGLRAAGLRNTADLAARLEEQRGQAERALEYAELYGSYAETEAAFDDRRLAALWGALDDDDRAAFCFDPKVVDWARYLHEVHLPSIVVHARVRTAPKGRTVVSREERGRAAVLSPDRHLAFFDLENTLMASNVVDTYAWLATRHLDPADRARFVARLLRQAPSLLALDRRDRGDFLRSFYRRYADAPARRLRDDSWEMFSDLLLARAFPAGLARVRAHRRAGHRTVLLTGALDFVVEPLRPLFDDILCATLGERGAVLTGELTMGPPTGEARAVLLADYAAAHGSSITDAVAYADSASDLPMLEAVGYPVAVNPEPKLATVARRRGWLVERWERSPGGPRRLLPLAAR
jgi:phosphoserine phosphatase/nucleoside-diphosphate-sugar epimerase